MKFLTDEDILKFINQHDYDVRKSGNARWIDQKCTADVICIISDCILNFYQENGDVEFTSRDIWYSKYSVDNIQKIFKKVDVEADSAENEYDKFFQQPMKLLAYAGILSETKNGRENVYKVINVEILQYLAIRERNVLIFLNLYITKVLKDSGLYSVFENFFVKQDKMSYDIVKDGFYLFTKRYTDIGSKSANNPDAGKTECGRIFTKVMNPLSYARNLKGSERGTVSKDIISYDMLMYNRDNFRDIYANKPKSVSRKDYISQVKYKPNQAFYSYLSNKAKLFLKKFNNTYRNRLSEIFEESEKDVPATQIHHIFPEGQFPIIAGYYENLIALTPNQHYIKAHPNNKTQSINRDYQYTCLVAKTSTIEENLSQNSELRIYEFDKFLYVLKIGLDDDSYELIEENDYNGILTKLAISYNK